VVASLKLTKLPVSVAARECRIALVGFGTVGRSVARILSTRPPQGLRLTHVYNRNVERKRVGWVDEHVNWTQEFDDVLKSDADVVVELVGGLDPAEQWVRRALESGKSVVTANKQLIARKGPELLKFARQHGQHLVYGASVAGGIPVLSGLQEGLAGDHIVKIAGILNGTCNFILSQIENQHMPFAEALEQAQAKGFAEANASEDIDGFDARAKLAILSRTALHVNVWPEQIATHGIREVEEIDFGYAHDLGCTIRQISRAELQEKTLFAGVQPALVPRSSPLARVSGSQNLVVSTGEFGGETVFSGFGAGGDPTAVAVVSDLVWVARNRHNGAYAYDVESVRELQVSSDFETRHYVRFKVADKPGILAALANVFSRHEINVDAVLQRPGHAKSELPFVVTLEPCRTQKVQEALNEIRKLDFHVAAPVEMPILG
jgi:homoserine dehydrogenase